MHTDHEDQQAGSVAIHPATSAVIRAAEELALRPDPGWRRADTEVCNLVTAIMRREAHLCQLRYMELLQAGAPEATAELLAQDDMGFQLVKSLANWATP